MRTSRFKVFIDATRPVQATDICLSTVNVLLLGSDAYQLRLWLKLKSAGNDARIQVCGKRRKLKYPPKLDFRLE